MSFFANIKNFLGISKDKNKQPEQSSQSSKSNTELADIREEETFHDEFARGIFSNDGASFFEEPPRDNRPRGFNIFTDPLEMHKYFEHQINEVLRNFGFINPDDSNLFFSSPNEDPRFAFYKNLEDSTSQTGELRDQYLKQGYEQLKLDTKVEKVDKDVDGRLNLGDLESIFGGHDTRVPLHQRNPTVRLFGQSVTSKTITHPDGSIETRCTVRDHEGNEETTITRKYCDKEYTITKQRNKDGKEENIENIINMDGISEKLLPNSEEKSPNWFPFDKFFK